MAKVLSCRLSELQELSLVDKSVVTVTPLTTKYSLTDISYKPIKNLASDILSII
jgi:DNA-binding HxlR family transcriptional regulator